MKTNYQDLIDKGLLKKENIDFIQVGKVLSKARNDLRSAKILLAENQCENTFELAYESMLSAGRALAFSFGLRPRAQGSHKTVVEFCNRILKSPVDISSKKFDIMRRKRHYLIYGAGFEISKIEARNAVKNADEFIGKIEKIIKEKNPQKELFN